MIAEHLAHACFRMAARRANRDEHFAASRWLLASLAFAPSTPISWLRLGNALFEQGDAEAALGAYRRAETLAPDDPQIKFNLGVTLLTLGQFDEGWRLYESRFAMPSFRLRNGLWGADAAKMWNGGFDALADRTILLFGEQGYGDSIMALRFVRVIANLAGGVIVRVPGQLFRLARASFRDVANVAVISDGERLPEHDLLAPLMSLPGAIGRYIGFRSDDPGAASPLWTPYLKLYREDEAVARPYPSVGLFWAGGPRPRGRSVPFAALAQLLDIKGVHWTSLQVGPRAADADACPAIGRPRLADFYDAAREIRSIDLVISIDSAPAHLAGALGVPVWTMLPFKADFRWLLNRSDTRWYPSMRLFRQPRAGDWASVIDAVRDALTLSLAQAPLRPENPATWSKSKSRSTTPAT